MWPESDNDSTVTITTTDGSDTITLTDTIDMGGDLSYSISDYTTTYSINDSLTTTLDSIVTGFDVKPEITIGKLKLTEEKLEKLLTLLDLIDEDPDFKSKLDMQSAINKLKK